MLRAALINVTVFHAGAIRAIAPQRIFEDEEKGEYTVRPRIFTTYSFLPETMNAGLNIRLAAGIKVC